LDKKNNTGFSSLSNLATEVNEGNEDVSLDEMIEKKPATSIHSSLDSGKNTSNELETPCEPSPKNTDNSLIQKIKFIAIKLIKWIFIVTAGAYALFFGITYSHDLEELRFNKDWIDWEWHTKENRIQKSTNTKMTLLRRVYKNTNYEIIAYKDDDYLLHAIAQFVAPCSPGTEIVTSSQWSNGEPKILKCDESGSYLRFGIMWSEKGTDVTWSEDFDGFSFTENFRYWDFTLLDKEITLSKAKKTTE